MAPKRTDYIFKVPFASSIYPHRKPSETLSILHCLNASRPPSKRFPTEILLRIQEEVHQLNPIYEDIRSTWTPFLNYTNMDPRDWDSLNLYNNYYEDEVLPLVTATFNHDLKRYQLPESIPRRSLDRFPSFTKMLDSLINLADYISSADLLYRLRSFFPEVCIDSAGPAGEKVIWSAGIRHNRTGFILGFSEMKGAAFLRIDLTPRVAFNGVQLAEEDTKADISLYYDLIRTSPAYLDMIRIFSADSVHLINMFSQTVEDGSLRLVYFHPAADADISGRDARYIAVPEKRRSQIRNPPDEPYEPWYPMKASVADLSPLSSFHSLLPNLKYDVESRKVDPVKGQTPLTSIISSSLLFYRLLCHYRFRRLGNTAVSSGAPITSVWQLELCHDDTHARVIFMDDHGLFDIRADEEAEEVMDDIVALVEALCSDKCTHPCANIVAGCYA